MIAVISSIDELLALMAQGHRHFVCTTMEPFVYARTVALEQEIQVLYISHFVQPQVISPIFEGLIPRAKQLMYEFDGVVTSFIEQQHNIRVSAFAAAFGYNLISVISILEVWHRFLTIVGEQYGRVVVANSLLTSWLPDTVKSEILSDITPENIEFTDITVSQQAKKISLPTKLRNLKAIAWLCWHNPDIVKKFIGNKESRQEVFTPTVSEIIFFEPLGELEGFRSQLSSMGTSYNTLRQDHLGRENDVHQSSFHTLDTKLQHLLSDSSPSLTAGFNHVWNLAKRLLPAYVSEAQWFSNIVEHSDVKVGVFGTAPILFTSSYPLLANVLLQQGKESVSVQHGGYDGDTLMPGFEDRFHVQLTTSTYITYGYNQEDHQRCYPLCQAVNIQEGGSNRVRHMGKASLDILYVPNNYPGLDQKIDGLFDHDMVTAQLAILSYLDTCKRQSLVKIRNPKNYPSSFFPVLEKTGKHVQVVWGIDATELLAFIMPKVIMYEEPSSTFLQSLQLDCEIFSLNRRFFPFESVAYTMLQKRVHFFDTVEEMTLAVEEFFEGKRAKKRDSSYVQHYLRGSEQLHRAVHAVLHKAGCTIPLSDKEFVPVSGRK